uniref:Hexosyltransferase n=1 Tax=Ixodes ricinus TaxID=34613 RepID=A0A147BQU7_IXORI
MQPHRLHYLKIVLVIVNVLMFLWVITTERPNRDRSENPRVLVVSSGNQNEKKRSQEQIKTIAPRDNHESSTTDYILYPLSLCRRNSSTQLDYLVMIFSAPGNFDQRNAIRETWASEIKEKSNSRTAFLLAKTENDKVQRAIESESYLHADIIQGTHIDHYRNLTLKTKMMMRWALKHCPKVSFLIKCDDDTFVNVENLLKAMKGKRTDAIYGHLFANSRPYREPSSKYYVSKEEYNGTEYPPFVAGAFYVLGGSILRRLYDASEQEPFFWLEDVFLTGFVAEKAGVNRTHESSITDDEFNCVSCIEKNSLS